MAVADSWLGRNQSPTSNYKKYTTSKLQKNEVTYSAFFDTILSSDKQNAWSSFYVYLIERVPFNDDKMIQIYYEVFP